MKNLIPIEKLHAHTHRLFLFAGNDASEKPVFAQCHLPGSHFLTLKDDLTGDATTGKGRHPLPAMHAFSDHMMDLGLSPDTPVLIYEDGPHGFAFRLWWMLKAIGVKDVVILYDPAMHWKEQGTDAPADKPAHKGKGLSFDPRSIIEMSGVKRLIENKEATLIDSRDKERYIGIKDEMDHKPGHIPTALSYPYEDLLTDKMPDEDTIRAHFQNLPTDKPLIIYCGSGVSAPWNILLLDEIGLQTTLYPGSFSGWIEDENNPIEKCI